MKSKLFYVSLLLLVATLWLQAKPTSDRGLTKAEKKKGWQMLFDGKSFSGWHSFKRESASTTGWVIEQGALHHLPKSPGGGDLISNETFEEFDLTWEWKLAPKANSGLKYFGSEKGDAALGHEYQMIDIAADPRMTPEHSTGSFYAVLPPESIPTKPVGEYNHSRVLVKGNQVTHWLNGTKVLSYELGSTRVLEAVKLSKFKSVPGFGTRLPGSILLQDHGDEVWFRNVKIRRLGDHRN